MASSRIRTRQVAPHTKTVLQWWDCNDNLIVFQSSSTGPFCNLRSFIKLVSPRYQKVRLIGQMKALLMYYNNVGLKVNKQSWYRDKWLSDETYFWAMKAQFPTLEALNFDRAVMNQAILKCGGATSGNPDLWWTQNSLVIYQRIQYVANIFDTRQFFFGYIPHCIHTFWSFLRT